MRKVIGVAFFWILWKLRNNKVFNEIMLKEKEICESIPFSAFWWVRCRYNLHY